MPGSSSSSSSGSLEGVHRRMQRASLANNNHKRRSRRNVRKGTREQRQITRYSSRKSPKSSSRSSSSSRKGTGKGKRARRKSTRSPSSSSSSFSPSSSASSSVASSSSGSSSSSSSVRGGKVKCASGQIKVHRKGTYVKGTKDHKGYYRKGTTYCMDDKGTPGKGPKKIPPLKKNALGKYGYNTSASAKKRLQALSRAVKAEGYKTIIDRLVAVMNLTKNTLPKYHKLYRTDITQLQCKYRPDDHPQKCKHQK